MIEQYFDVRIKQIEKQFATRILTSEAREELSDIYQVNN